MIVIVFFVVVCGILIALISSRGSKSAKLVPRMRAIPGFSPKYVYPAPFGGSVVGIDPITQRFALAATKASIATYAFDQLIQVEVYRDDAAVHDLSKMAGGALVGGLLLGPLGMVVGGLRKAKTKAGIRKLALRVYVDDFDRPAHEIIFLSSKKKLAPTSPQAQRAARLLEEWYGRFNIMRRTVSSSVPRAAGGELAVTEKSE